MTERRIGVLGAGTMGAGIAQLGGLAGLETLLHDADPDALEGGRQQLGEGLAKGAERGRWSAGQAEAALQRIRPVAAIDDLADCELVIEAVPERLELKRDLFAKLEDLLDDGSVLATNTSSLSVTAVANGAADPGRIVGMHFFNPPPLMALVEIVAGERSDPDALDLATEVAERMGRTAIRVSDGIGFLANRLARPFSLEALGLLAEGVADVPAIDRILRTAAGFRMGPFELMDLVGIDVGLEVAKSFWEQSFHEPRWRPSVLVQRMVDAGRLGRKTGRGWYDYSDGPHRPEDPHPGPGHTAVDLIDAGERDGQILARVLSQLVNEAHFAVAAKVGSEADADTATRLGLNWPQGPFAWCEELGAARVVAALDLLWEGRREERFRVAPTLRQRAHR